MDRKQSKQKININQEICNRIYEKQLVYTQGFLDLAGGGIAKSAGDRSGPPPERGPNSQGLQGLLKRVRNL